MRASVQLLSATNKCLHAHHDLKGVKNVAFVTDFDDNVSCAAQVGARHHTDLFPRQEA